jgi:hypothetical protein
MTTANNEPDLTGGGSTPPPPAADTPPPGDKGGTPPPAPSWRDTLTDDLKGDPSLATFQDVATLAKSYIHAQKQIGKDKIVIPDKHASDDDWKNVFHKLGLPKDVKDYALDIPKEAGLDEGFIEKFKEAALGAGVMPKSAKALLEWYSKAADETVRQTKEVAETKNKELLEGLKKDWGTAYDRNLQAARLAIKDFADEDTVKYLNESGLSKNVQLLKLFSKVGLATKEPELRAGAERGGNVMAPKEAQEKVSAIYGNPSHPYWNKNHPSYHNAVKEVADLMAMVHPPEDKK